jgi:uncharacterized protein with ParB-like and HNH nuclease domain
MARYEVVRSISREKLINVPRSLWEDLSELYEEESARNHFIGSIVTMPTQSVPEGVAKYLLIDGQQRFTTIFVLLAVLRDKAKATPDSTLWQEIEQTLLTNPFKHGNDTFKLLPTQGDRESFLSVMRGEIGSRDDQITRAYRFYFLASGRIARRQREPLI